MKRPKIRTVHPFTTTVTTSVCRQFSYCNICRRMQKLCLVWLKFAYTHDDDLFRVHANNSSDVETAATWNDIPF